jgi:hypothetical protein
VTTHQEKLTALQKLLSSMDIPSHRKKPSTNDGLRWLAKCIAQRNTEHPKYAEAIALLSELGHPVRGS